VSIASPRNSRHDPAGVPLDDEPNGLRKLWAQLGSRDLPGWALSIGVHLLVVLVMLGFRIQQAMEEDGSFLSSLEELQQELAFDTTTEDQVGTNTDANLLLSPGSLTATAASVDAQAQASLDKEVDEPVIQAMEETLDLPPEKVLSGSVDTTGGTVENVAQGGGIEGAIDRLTWEIQQSLHERKTTVIWLFDPTLSLKDRRNAIADRFENVYRQLESLGEGGQDALHTVMATFAKDLKFLTEKPVSDIKPLISKLRSIPDDKDGIENIFGAVVQLAKKYRSERAKGRNVRIFIITDERGDDAERYLEEAIVLCRRNGMRVYVVGNVAPFGVQKAYMNWTYEDGVTEEIGYDAGPETVRPENLNLGFWGNRGPELSRISSGYGPYALTRLCKETGGLYFIAKEDTRIKFNPAVLRNYPPDYRPIVEYQKSLGKNKALTGLVNAAEASRIDNLMLPQLSFPAYNDNVLRETVTEAQRPAAVLGEKIERLLALLLPGEKDRERISEPRWRAAFDLALGRALAMKVRTAGYNQMLAEMKGMPKPMQKKDSNEWRIVPSKTINAGQSIKKDERRAAALLKRVIDEHPETPWALIAEIELSTPMGWDWQEANNPMLFPANTTQDEARRQIQLAQDRAREEAKKRPPPVQRERPKL
jgi:hypothetical protein